MKKLLLILILGFISMVNGQTCAPVGVPFIQSFGGGALPNCWVNQNPVSTNTYALWRFSGAPGYGATNNGKPTGTYAWVDASSPYDNLHNVELLSPQINLTGLTDPYVEFEWFKNHLTSATGTLPNYDNNALRVHVNDGTGWVQIFSDTSNHDEWRTVGISLGAAYVGATIQLRFTVDKDVNGNGYFYDDVLLDEIQVKQAPTCFEPTALLVTNITPTSVTVDWTAANPAPAQGYEYYFSTVNTPPTAATVGTPVAAGVTTATFTPVTQGTTYYWWVRSVCSPTDKTAWVPGLPFVPGNFGPSPLPYHQDFTNGYDFTLIGNQTNKWFYGSAAGNPANSIYISNDNGASNTYTNNSTSVAHAYKDLIIPAGATSATFSFDWRAYGESCCDYIRVWLVPATFTPTAGAQITAGSGRIQVGGNMNLQSNWQTYMNTNLNISSFAGSMMRLVFEWRNDGSVGTMPPAAIDNINLLIPTCPTPTNMNVSNVTPNSATLGWTGITPVPANGYEYYLSTTNTPPTAATAGTAVPGPTANLTTLTPGTTYYWWVRAICSPTGSSFWVAGPSFTPGQIGSGTATSGMLPVYSCYGYNYSQQLYTAAEVAGAVGTNVVINRIRFFVSTTTTQANYNQWVVYMGNTNKTSFTTTTDWVPYSDLSQVYSGTLPNMTPGTWVEITLNTPFVWDGTNNIVIAVDENASGYSCTANWGSYSAGTNRGMLYYSDSTNPDPVSPPTASSRYADIPRLQLVSEPMPPCTAAAPATLNVSGLTTTTANLSWSPAAGAVYVVQWRPVTTPASAWTTVTPSPTGSSYLLQGLTEQTQYEFRVAYNCSGTIGAYATPVQFTTPALSYCTSNPTSTSAYEFISNVTVNPVGAATMISNSTGTAQAYTDYTNDPTRLVQLVIGTTGNSVSVSKQWTGTQYGAGTGVWIDFNRNGTFEASERVLNSPSNTVTPVSETFAVPMPPLSYNGPLKTRMRVVLQEGSNPSACGTFTWGEVEDYDVQLIMPPACTAAAPTNLSVSNITNVSANLSWMPAQGATYVVQWRKVTTPASAWTTVTPNPTVSAHTLTGLEEQTQYEFRVAYICGTTQGAFATPVQFTTEQLPYCAANPTNNTTRTYISNVTTNAVGAPALVSNSTGAAGYTDYTGDPSRLATFIMGTANNTVSVSKSWAGTQYAAGVGVWIDFNRNGTFEATERVVTSTSNLTTPIVSAPFTVPLPPGAYNGPLNTRMRVIVQEAGNPSACGTFTYGEVEDYDVRLVEPIPCTTAAPQGLGAGNMSPVSATLTWMPATGAQYVVQWRPVTTPASPWTVVTPAPVDSYHILTGLMEQTTYEFQVAYICSGTQGAFSTPYQFTTPPLQWCNAGSTVTNVDDHITNVTVDPTGFPIFPTMSNNSGTSNYTNYYFDTTKRVSLVLGSTGNTISVSKGWVNAPNNVAIDAWIDFNRDGVFDVTELIMSFTPSQTTPVVATFDVPAVGYAGNLPTKMRVIARRTSPAAACGTFDYGEVEDYAVDLVEPIPCNSNPVANLQVTGITHNTATVTWTPDPGGATYIVRHKPVGAANWTAQIPVTFLTGTYTIPNLTPSTQYIVEVVALCDNVPGTPAEIPFETLCNPEPPTNFVVTNITPDSAVVTWDPVPSASYVVEYREVGSTTWTTVNVTTNSYTLTNLDPYTTYEVRVASVCSGAQNPFSTPVVFTTLPTCEMAPVGLIITNLTMTTAQIDWNAFPGASYELRWRKVGNSGWNSVTVNTNTYILTGLTEETQYEVMIANICNGGLQQFTHPYVFTTPTLVYCNMEGANSSDEFISNVTVKPAGGTEMTNDSGASGYTSYVDAIDKMIVLAQGSTGNQISITKQWTGQVYNEAVTVWIDFNRDGKFANDERILIAPANTNNPAAGTFSVPADAYVSLTNDKYLVMRVAMRRNGSPEMCSTFDNGEVEDYKVRIVKPRPNNIMDNNQVILYPNPVKNILNVTKVKDGATYKVYNSIGQLIQNGAIFSNRMDVSKLISGVYIIDITDTNGETVQKKFIKE